jgi:hypothetical protein
MSENEELTEIIQRVQYDIETLEPFHVVFRLFYIGINGCYRDVGIEGGRRLSGNLRL